MHGLSRASTFIYALAELLVLVSIAVLSSRVVFLYTVFVLFNLKSCQAAHRAKTANIDLEPLNIRESEGIAA
jgi:hypothetical protein